MGDWMGNVRLGAVGSSAQEIGLLRELCGGEIPADYLAFLELSNGAELINTSLAIAAPWGLSDTYVGDLLPATNPDYELGSVSGVHRFYIRPHEQRMPRMSLPIARDPGGNWCLLSCEPQTFGIVYFWDHESEFPENIERDTVYDFRQTMVQVASSFTDFVSNSLRSDDEHQREMQRLRNVALPPMPTPGAERVYPKQHPVGLIDGSPTQVYGWTKVHGLPSYDTVSSIPTTDSFRNPEPILDSWQPPEVEVKKTGKESPIHLDIPYRNSSLVMRPSAKTVMAEFLRPFGELLPLTSNQGQLFVFHCLNEIDAAKPNCFREDTRDDQGLLRLGNAGYQFQPDLVAGEEIFTLPQPGFRQRLYLTKSAAIRFTQLAQDNELNYYPLMLLWENSE